MLLKVVNEGLLQYFFNISVLLVLYIFPRDTNIEIFLVFIMFRQSTM